MNKKYFLVLALLLSFFVCQKYIYAEETNGTVIINEIAWMGNLNSSSDEWIELKNSSSADIDLKNWQLFSTNTSLKISLAGTIRAGGYFLLEVTMAKILSFVIRVII